MAGQVGEIPESIAAQGIVLQPHPVGVLDLLDAGGEMSVPEKSHLFEQRRRAMHHPVEPPPAQIENLLAFHHALHAHFFLPLGRVFLGHTS